jgi:DNA replication and repair protein RecF
MRLMRLEAAGVRNLSALSIDCGPGLNVFTGPNGAGKTAIIETVHLLARGRSFRSGSIGAVICHGSGSLTVRARLNDEHRGEIRATVVRHRNDRSELHLNGRIERRLSEIARLMPLQLLLPDASSLVFGAPQERRRFLDWGAFHVKPRYLAQLRDYQRVLQQRNVLLRAPSDRTSGLAQQLQAWTDQLSVLGREVDTARQEYLALLLPAASSTLRALASELALTFSYQSGWRDGATLEDCLREGGARDVRFGVTHCGPHRADLHLTVGGQPAAAVLSRGQAKVVASALRLAQAELTNQIGGRRSLFLIDDVGAEMDAPHNERFFGALEAMDCQVFATTTSDLALGGAFAGARRQLFHVEHGSCHQIDTKEP